MVSGRIGFRGKGESHGPGLQFRTKSGSVNDGPTVSPPQVTWMCFGGFDCVKDCSRQGFGFSVWEDLLGFSKGDLDRDDERVWMMAGLEGGASMPEGHAFFLRRMFRVEEGSSSMDGEKD